MRKNKKSSKEFGDQRTEFLESTDSQVPSVPRLMDTQDDIGENNNRKICHGLDCSNIAIHSIHEDGYDGTLMLCDDCITKFPTEVIRKSRNPVVKQVFRSAPSSSSIRTCPSDRSGTKL